MIINKIIIKRAIIWKVVILTIMASFYVFLNFNSGGLVGADENWGFLESWDGKIYHFIAETGYVGTSHIIDQTAASATVFFPLFPLMIKIFSYITFGHFLLAGQIVNTIAFLSLIVLLFKLLSLDYDQSRVKRIITYFLLFPASFYLAVNYSEPLFLFLIVGAIYFYRISKFPLAIILAILATASRPVGILIFPILILEYFQNINFNFKLVKKDILYLFLIPIGLISYMIYLYFAFDNPLLFWQQQSSYWGRSDNLIGIFKSVGDIFKNLFYYYANHSLVLLYSGLLELFALIFWLVLTVVAFIKRIRYSYLFFIIFMIVIPLNSSNTSLLRFVGVTFPLFIVLDDLMGNKKLWRYTIIVLFVILSLGALALFSNGYWVA